MPLLKSSILALSAVLCAAASIAHAQGVKPCDTAGFHQWDFWLGAWRVTDEAGVFQGENLISLAPSGCGFVEQWTGAGGTKGMSFNVYDPTRGTWTQLWTAPGTVIRLEGKLDEHGAIRTEGEIAYAKNRVVHPFRGVWTPNPDGSVTQAFFEQDPTTKAWKNWFTGIYRRTG